MMRHELPLLTFSDATAFESWLAAQPDDAVGAWLRFAKKGDVVADDPAHTAALFELWKRLVEQRKLS
jgi:hypothetical protein